MLLPIQIVFAILTKKIERKPLLEKYRRSTKFRKNRNSKKTSPCYVKRLSDKYGKNSKNNSLTKFYIRLALGRLP